MSEILIPINLRHEVANIFTDTLKVRPHFAWEKFSEKVSPELIWNERNKFHAFPSLASLGATAATHSNGFWNPVLLERMGLDESFFQDQIFSIIEVAAGANGKIDDDELYALENGLREFVAAQAPVILTQAKAAIYAATRDNVKSHSGENFIRVHATDLEAIYDLNKRTLNDLAGMDPGYAARIGSWSHAGVNKAFGRNVSDDDYDILEELSVDDAKALASLPEAVAESIQPHQSKTKNDILLSLVFASPMLPQEVTRMLFDQYLETGQADRAVQHPVFKNTVLVKKGQDEKELILKLKIIVGQWPYDDRIAYMSYRLKEFYDENGKYCADIIISQVYAKDQNLPSLDGIDGFDLMKTMEGMIQVREKNGRAIMTMSVIGNPNLFGAPDSTIAKKLSKKYIELASRAAFYLSKHVFEKCLTDEFTSETTVCRIDEVRQEKLREQADWTLNSAAILIDQIKAVPLAFYLGESVKVARGLTGLYLYSMGLNPSFPRSTALSFNE